MTPPLFMALVLTAAASVPPDGWPGRHDIGEEAGAAALTEARATWNDQSSWGHRARRIRQHLATTLHLDPPPDPGPVGIEVTGRLQQDGYTIENVRFETMPGLFVHANVYRPDGDTMPRPLVLRAHGHFRGNETDPEGRFQGDVQRIAGLLARGGAIVVTWDMMGWGESHQVTHRRPETTALQTFNTMRILDAMLAGDAVDPERVAMTGSSGGGTQTFLATALDPRIRFSAPVVMVSAHFFGGCPCESGFPVHQVPADGDLPEIRTSNVEFAALAAPRPQRLVSVGGDWTLNTPELEFPYLQAVYDVMGARDAVSNRHYPEENHDYGLNKIDATLDFLTPRLGLDSAAMRTAKSRPDLDSIRIRSRSELCSTTDTHPLPDHAMQGDEVVWKAYLALPRDEEHHEESTEETSSSADPTT